LVVADPAAEGCTVLGPANGEADLHQTALGRVGVEDLQRLVVQ
jgi:hypothetical protein